MICKPCSVAGDMVAQIRDTQPNIVMEVGERWVRIPTAAKSLAKYLHGKCQGPTHCDCQHMVDMEGKAIAQTEKPGELTSQDRESAGKAS